jgi:indole-3-glycerol phosphate synthase
MGTILDTILSVKRREAADLLPRLADLRAACRSMPPPRGFAAALRKTGPDPFSGAGTVPFSGRSEKGAVPIARPSRASAEKGTDPFSESPEKGSVPSAPIRIVAEIKHRSPSAGVIIEPFEPAAIAQQYAAAGADAISCLTDREFFGGCLDDLRLVRAAVGLPVLRKDFLLTPVQVYEARAAGADAILLIAEAMERTRMTELADLAAELGMDILAEAHSEAALEKAIECRAACIGINNRDLTTFKVDLATTERLAPQVLAAGRILVAESGVHTAADVRRLRDAGADAILVGEGLLRCGAIAAKLAEFKNA